MDKQPIKITSFQNPLVKMIRSLAYKKYRKREGVFWAEGVRNTKVVRELAGRQGVEMPIVEAVYRVLYEDLDPGDVLGELFGRSLKPEFA